MKPLILALSLFVAGCSTITIQTASTEKLTTPPTYEERFNFFLWGVIGTGRVNVSKICGDREVLQMQSIITPLDLLFPAFTGGFYMSKTARVWCGEV